MPAQISIRSLLLSSGEHQDALLKILNYLLSHKVLQQKILSILWGQIIIMNMITFTEDELTPEATGHVKLLHIAVESHGMIIAGVFIHNGAALNFFHAMTFQRVGFEETLLCPAV